MPESVVVFGLAGLGAGIVSARIMVRGLPPPGTHRSPLLAFFCVGAVFLVALVGAFQLCHGQSWSRFLRELFRPILTGSVISISAIASLYLGIFAGVTAAVLVGSPAASHSWVFYATPVVTVIASAGLVFAFLLSVALFIFTKAWDLRAWTCLIFSDIAATIVTLLINPKILVTLRYTGISQPDTVPTFAIMTFLVCGLMLYGACAGYWIARASRADSVGSPRPSD